VERKITPVVVGDGSQQEAAREGTEAAEGTDSASSGNTQL